MVIPFDPTGLTQDQLYKAHLPDNFYRNHYQLAQLYPQHTAEEWRLYVRSQERFILNEIASITEASARQSLSKLADGNVSSQEIQAIKQLLERSEQINQSSQEQRTFVTTLFSTDPPKPKKTAKQKEIDLMTHNRDTIHRFYGLDNSHTARKFGIRERNKEVHRNQSGTLHIPEEYQDDVDRAYLRMFNPDNVKTDALPDFKDDGDDDIQ